MSSILLNEKMIYQLIILKRIHHIKINIVNLCNVTCTLILLTTPSYLVHLIDFKKILVFNK